MSLKNVLAGCVLVILVATAFADGWEPLRIHCEWTAPTEGSPVVLYQLQLRNENSMAVETYIVPAQEGPTQEYIITDADFGEDYKARVRGLDADGDEGPWSEWSDLFWREAPEPAP